MKKTLAILLTLVLALSLVGCAQQAAPAAESAAGEAAAPAEPASSGKTTYVSIATASLGGSYYPIGVGMAEVYKETIDGVEVSVEVTGGAAENPKLVGAGESDIGFTNANLAFAAYNGTGAFEGNAYPDLRIMFSGVAPGTIHLVVKDSTEIHSYNDLKGKKIAVGPQGGGLLSLLPDLLGMYNLTLDDMNCSFMSFDEGVQAVIDGNLDGAFVQAPHPSAAIQTIQGSNVGFRLIEVEEDIRNAFIEKYPYYNLVDIPADTYGTPTDIKTVGSTNAVVCNANLDTELVYQMVKNMFENLDKIHDVHPSASSISLETAVSKMFPMHDGAVRYFTEMGVY